MKRIFAFLALLALAQPVLAQTSNNQLVGKDNQTGTGIQRPVGVTTGNRLMVDTGGAGGGGPATIANGADVAEGSTTDASGASTVVGQLKAIAASTATPPTQAVVGTGTAGTPAGGVLTVQGQSGGTSQNVTAQDMAPVTATPGASLNAVLFTADTSGYGGVAFSLGGTFVGTITFQASEDNITYSNVSVQTALLAATGSATAPGLFYYPASHRYFRAQITAYTSGTISPVAYLRASVATPVGTVSLGAGSNLMGYTGGAGVDGAIYAQQSMGEGCLASSTLPTTTTTGFKQREFCTPEGALGIAATTSAGAAYGLRPLTTAGVTTVSAKASAGNVYSLNVCNSTVAGFVILYDSATAITGGATLTAASILYPYAVPASTCFDKAFPMPVSATAGIQVLFSTNLTTYTATGTAPSTISIAFK